MYIMRIKLCLINFCKKYYSKKLVRNYSSSGDDIPSTYKPSDVERETLRKWTVTTKLSFNRKQQPQFTMILPPPNITGHLHLGHALMCIIQDVISRRKQQQGYDVVWVPGVDHAGIATQVVVEKNILKEMKMTRHELGREKFLEQVWKWKFEKTGSIFSDLKKLGCSLDWEKTYFTMDKVQQRAVDEAFISLFDEGLIVRKKSMVNWSCSLESAISDIEVEPLEINAPTPIVVPGHKNPIIFGQLFNLAYKICGHKEEEIIVSTTRPETLLGDVAVAVHPHDVKYRKYVGTKTKLWHPFRKEEIPLIFESKVDPCFGTGAVKITPAHNKNDLEIANRHSLPSIEVFNKKGQIVESFKNYAFLPRFECRYKIIKDLSLLKLFKSVKPHKMIVPLCSRSKDVIEYMLLPQWFLKCEDMAQNAMEVIRSGKIKIHPSSYENEWYRWLRSTKDWCISRQLWWGHKIPVYEISCYGKKIWIAAQTEKDALKKVKTQFHSLDNILIERDSDVLDTWFSSALLPFSVFGWPNKTFQEHYPLDLIETGHDILFFWVARMVMLGMKLTDNIPFKNILLNGIVCDVHGRKMSKSLGNVISPRQIISGNSFEVLKTEIETNFKRGFLSSKEYLKSVQGLKKTFPSGIPECGTDALRFTLCSYNIKNHFIKFDVSECYANKLFFNKIWQASRYTLNTYKRLKLNWSELNLNNVVFSPMDFWILSRLTNTIKICNKNFENYNFHLVTSALKTFFYSNFCDVYLETTKFTLSQNSEKAIGHSLALTMCITSGLKVMSPITPFLCEELLQYFPKLPNTHNLDFNNSEIEVQVQDIIDVCTSIRKFKSQMKILKKHAPKVYLYPHSKYALSLLGNFQNEIKTLSNTNDVYIENSNDDKIKNSIQFFNTASHICTFGIILNEEYLNTQSDKNIHQNQLEKLQISLNKLNNMISMAGYKKAANEITKEKHLNKIKNLKIEINSIKEIIEF